MLTRKQRIGWGIFTFVTMTYFVFMAWLACMTYQHMAETMITIETPIQQ